MSERERNEGAPGGEAGEVEHTGRRVERETRIAADPEKVWNAWTDPELIAGWFVERAVNRAEEGGRVTWAWDRFGMEIEQEVVVADSPRRLVLRAAERGEARILEVTLEGGVGETVVRVVESGFGEGPDVEGEIEGFDAGWAIALALLRRYVERWYGRSKSELIALRPVAGECARVRPYFRTPEGLAEWLTGDAEAGGDASAAAADAGRGAAPASAPEPGAPTSARGGETAASAVDAHPRELVLRNGGTVTGAVLEEAHDEFVRAWEEVDGTLEFKAFAVPGDSCVVGLRAVSWSRSQDEMDRFQPVFDAAVERLAARLG